MFIYNKSQQKLDILSSTLHYLTNRIMGIILAPLSLFTFLFYVFWTYPVQILSQEFPIGEYFIVDNIFLSLSFILFIFLSLALLFSYRKYPKIYNTIIGLIIIFLIWTFLYKNTISYDYGGFTDNVSLTTVKPILGFSFWFFVLDALFPIISIIITIFALKKNFYKPLLLIFFTFYTTENIITLANLKITTPVLSDLPSNSITLSTNHKNLLFFMLDSVPSPLMLDIINNQWGNQQKEWTKDFTFYDNVTTLSVGGTVGSLPPMFGGYSFTPQNQVAYLRDNKINLSEVDTTSLKFYPVGLYLYTDMAIQSIDNKINMFANTSYKYIQDKDINEKNNAKLVYHYPPILIVSLYNIMPYIFRNKLVLNHLDRKNTFTWRLYAAKWKYFYNIKWLPYFDFTKLLFEETDKGKFYILENDGIHAPHWSPTSTNLNDFIYPNTEKFYHTILYNQLTYNTENILNIIKALKKHDIYNNTRIIVTSDHGLTSTQSFELTSYFKKLLQNKGIALFFDNDFINQTFLPQSLPVFIMDKNFNTTQANMQMDSRFLSLGDLHNTIANTFISNYTEADFLSVLPPKRIFNIPSLSYAFLKGDLDRSDIKDYLSNDNLSFIKVKDILEGDIEISSFDLNNIEELPSVELLN